MSSRKKLIVFALGLFLFSAGCLPVRESLLRPGSREDLRDCLSLFPSQPWESVHKIEAYLGGGNSVTLLGVTRGDPVHRLLHSFLLTAEGFTLFEAELREDQVMVRRAVAPFDSREFSERMMADVAFLFFAPKAFPLAWGRDDGGTRVCRWTCPKGSQIEVRENPDQGWQIVKRNDQGWVTGQVLLNGPFIQGLASQVKLEAFRPVAYTLKMTLLQSGP
jgi:hypothetical protein